VRPKYTKPTHICIACDQHGTTPICHFCHPFDDRTIRDAEDLRAHIRAARRLDPVQVIDIPQQLPPLRTVAKNPWGRPIERKRRTVGRGTV
jgi:hypothetical protein